MPVLRGAATPRHWREGHSCNISFVWLRGRQLFDSQEKSSPFTSRSTFVPWNAQLTTKNCSGQPSPYPFCLRGFCLPSPFTSAIPFLCVCSCPTAFHCPVGPCLASRTQPIDLGPAFGVFCVAHARSLPSAARPTSFFVLSCTHGADVVVSTIMFRPEPFRISPRVRVVAAVVGQLDSALSLPLPPFSLRILKTPGSLNGTSPGCFVRR